MPKGNATEYCFQCWLVNGHLQHSERKLMNTGRVISDVQKAVSALRSGETIYLEAIGLKLNEVKTMIAGGANG